MKAGIPILGTRDGVGASKEALCEGDALMTLSWRVEDDVAVLESGFPLLGKRGPRIDRLGVEGGLLRRRRWPWRDVAALTWDTGHQGGALAVCVYGDPWVKQLGMVAWRWDASWDAVRSLLEEIRPFVERIGGRVENRDEAATHWWHLEPGARRRTH